MRSFFYKIAVKFFPELMSLKNYFSNSEKEDNVMLYSVYKIDHSKIGAYTYIAQNSIINHTTIGRFCSIGANFVCGWGVHPLHTLSTSPMFYSTKKQNGTSLSKTDKIQETKPIIIGNDVFIGMNVTVLDGVEIGDGAVIGAGSVVSQNIPPYAIAVGCPIQIIKFRHAPETIEKLMQIKWWNWNINQLQEVEKYFDDIKGFVAKHSN